MKKIAITGGNGFVGQAMLRLLKNENFEITLLDRKNHNLLDSESLKDFVENQDIVLHLAGVNRGTNQELLQTNTLGMLSLLEAVTKYSPTTQIIFASTFQVYLPQSLYGLSKKFAEDLLIQYGLTKNIKSTILRLSNIYGPEGKPFYNSVIATFAYQIKQGESLNINGDGSQVRDYIYVDDVAEAFLKAIKFKQTENTETIDICSGVSTSLKTVIQILEKNSGKNINVVYNDAKTEKPWPTANKNYKEAKEKIGWEPKTNIEEGLKEVMK